MSAYATIDGVHYCHGDYDITFEQACQALEHGMPPTCYELETGKFGPLAHRWLDTQERSAPPTPIEPTA